MFYLLCITYINLVKWENIENNYNSLNTTFIASLILSFVTVSCSFLEYTRIGTTISFSTNTINLNHHLLPIGIDVLIRLSLYILPKRQIAK